MSEMALLHDLAKEHTVKLSAGSGVLINGATDAYSYVLTAKHVVMGCGTNEEPNCVDCSACTIKDVCSAPECSELLLNKFNGDQLTATEMYHAEKWDALILKVPFQSNLSLSISLGDIEPNARITLLGYPKNERENASALSSQIRRFECLKHDQTKDIKRIIVRNDSFADQAGVEGFSGGGLFDFDIEINSVILVGIENRMDNDEAQHGHICGVMLSAYTEIIEENQLAELKSPHLSDFKHSQIHVFHPYDLSNAASLDGVKSVLLGIIQERILPSNATPGTILAKFTDKLLAYRQKVRDLEEARLWIWFLEFLVIQLATKPPNQFQNGWETSYLDELFSSYRFIYSSRHIGFKSIYRELLLPTSGLEKLPENSKIVLLTDGKFPPLPLLDKSKLNRHTPDISQPSQADIATVRQNKKLKNDVLHWLKLNDECLIECEEDFAKLNAFDNEPEIQELLTTKYAPYLVIEE